ncbi:putative protein N(5)-glutamine methyltransferase [Nocardia sp. NPDC127579]|uniref:putative protein N(5)-glutamine methyltransferase n=1 Tax=Nocardia sp. NPDC127579 TaxID=3345402 RepID=UPI00363EB8F6
MAEREVAERLRAAGCVFAEDEARLLLEAAADDVALAELVARRVTGEPLEYLVGWAEFRGERVAVTPGVFVPRRRTAFLVEEAVRLARAFPKPIAVDLCCGSGAVGLSFARTLAAEGIEVQLSAADLEPVAVECARRNLAGLGTPVHQGDLFDALPGDLRGHIDILLANTPYVPTDLIARMPAEARDHELRTALDGGSDGLDIFRRVVAGARAWLAPGGHLLAEAGAGQTDSALRTLEAHGLAGRIAESEEYYATVVIGTR